MWQEPLQSFLALWGCSATDLNSHANLNFLQYTVRILVPHIMWSAQAVHDSKIDHTNAIYLPCTEPEARNSAVGWHWKTYTHTLLCTCKMKVFTTLPIPAVAFKKSTNSPSPPNPFIYFHGKVLLTRQTEYSADACYTSFQLWECPSDWPKQWPDN